MAARSRQIDLVLLDPKFATKVPLPGIPSPNKIKTYKRRQEQSKLNLPVMKFGNEESQ